ncbi:hypothetical protein AAHE18_05G260800 [Arachis hypogaea]
MVYYNTHTDLYTTPAVNWRDTLSCVLSPRPLHPLQLPSICSFLTVLLQDQVGGLQVLYENQWIDITPIPGALIINLGDLMQLITNSKFVSSKHRVLAQKTGPRVSVACFFRQHFQP